MARILIIDDEERNRRLFDVLLRADGHDLLFAATGRIGVEMAIAELPDLILLDLMMPGMDGFEVTRGLKSNLTTKSIPIVVVSSLDDIASRQRMVAMDIDEYIVKPVNRWELSQKISNLLKLPALQKSVNSPDNG